MNHNCQAITSRSDIIIRGNGNGIYRDKVGERDDASVSVIACVCVCVCVSAVKIKMADATKRALNWSSRT